PRAMAARGVHTARGSRATAGPFRTDARPSRFPARRPAALRRSRSLGHARQFAIFRPPQTAGRSRSFGGVVPPNDNNQIHGRDRRRSHAQEVKNYILDTNVLLHDPNSLLNFEDNNVLIPIEVLEEIDRFKRESTELSQNA